MSLFFEDLDEEDRSKIQEEWKKYIKLGSWGYVKKKVPYDIYFLQEDGGNKSPRTEICHFEMTYIDDAQGIP